MQSFKRELPCRLTDEEIRNYSDELARLTSKQAELEDAKKESTSDFKAKIDSVIAQNRVLARKISNKSEHRPVECRWEFHWEAGEKYLIRTDTGEEIENDIISEREKQERLFP